MVCNYTNPTKGVLNGSSINYRLQVLGLAKATLPNILPFSWNWKGTTASVSQDTVLSATDRNYEAHDIFSLYLHY